MYQVIMQFLDFLGVSTEPPETVGEFLVWFVLVCACFAILRFILKLFFDLVKTLGRVNL